MYLAACGRITCTEATNTEDLSSTCTEAARCHGSDWTRTWMSGFSPLLPVCECVEAGRSQKETCRAKRCQQRWTGQAESASTPNTTHLAIRPPSMSRCLSANVLTCLGSPTLLAVNHIPKQARDARIQEGGLLGAPSTSQTNARQ